MIQVALADDHTILRKGVAEILSRYDDVTVCIEAANGLELINKMKTAPVLPDVCILDINMPELNGYETAAEIRKTWPHIKLLALSMYDTELNIIRMLRSGANGYILKDADPEELYTSVVKVMRDGFYCSELVTGRMFTALNDPRERASEEISDKELQFLELCCTELTYKEIAARMYLSPRTIDGYRENLFRKLSITTRTGLVMYAIRAGVVSVS